MRLLVLYASDLAPRSRVAPGGITSNVRGYLSGLPRDWQIEVWGVAERGVVTAGTTQSIPLADRSVRLLPLVEAGPASGRRVPLSPRYAAALAGMAVRGRLDRRHWDVVIAHRAEYLAAIGLVRPAGLLPPAIAMIHTSPWYYRTMGRLRGSAYLLGEWLAIRRATAVALVSGASLPEYRARYAQWADRFYWIPNGVDLTRFVGPEPQGWREAHGFHDRDRLLIYHGRYDAEKGIARILAVLRLLLADGGPWHLVCAGVGPLASLLARAAAGWGRNHIHDLGYLAPSAIVDLLRAGDIGVLFSDYEGLSNGLLEALAAGLPVVATDVGDNALVLGRLASELIAGPDPASLAGAVRWAWANRQRLRERAREIAGQFSLRARIERLTSLIETVGAGNIADYAAAPA
jgi:glycosyltransferase involved in cell wall biosynthesis